MRAVQRLDKTYNHGMVMVYIQLAMIKGYNSYNMYQTIVPFSHVDLFAYIKPGFCCPSNTIQQVQHMLNTYLSTHVTTVLAQHSSILYI